ncbi:MAG TPA: hypothetical protein VF546_03760 [Pyrinomonadaceae bacterium]|jgi:hypothetical protein
MGRVLLNVAGFILIVSTIIAAMSVPSEFVILVLLGLGGLGLTLIVLGNLRHPQTHARRRTR